MLSGMADESTRYAVTLACGHDFTEHRPSGMALPADGELRACGHPEHYPLKFAATYQPITEQEFWDRFRASRATAGPERP
jgi:hypothetical protein